MDPTQRLESLLVSDVMTRDVATIDACKDMNATAAALHKLGISSAPVIDEAGRTVGIISATDFLKRDTEANDYELDCDGSEPVHMEEVLDRTASYMSTAVQGVEPGDTLLHAAKVMVDSHLHRLPVMEGSKTVGILSTMDIVAALLKVIDERSGHEID